MGENEGLFESGGALPNGLLPGAGPIMQALDTDRWLKAEERVTELIACIQPNPMSEERRNAVADYVQRLIMKCFPCQVCTFGSVPLKTYLPDGDIDLTAFSHNQSMKDTWANQVRDMLENEEKNENAEFHVKEVQYIQAEVKIIKCLVENIVVDISFNQVGGLCTLCFLDEVDNLINQNHLFKRSIILIKAWCYYESRILGAHHGLISTYALETLVLYIFHVFNNSFHGPLEVLYRFLEFFSNFDWDNFCVSLWGPVPISSLPDVTAEPPRKDSGELLLSKLFLDACSLVYAVFPGGQENNGQQFVSKHFNVIDPLRVNNNLGRSVSKGNFFRIRSAFAFGAKRLARLLDCPSENLIFEVNQFFMNTWERHGSGHRPDAPPPVDSYYLRLSTPDSSHDFDNSNNSARGKKKNENSSANRVDGEGIRTHGFTPPLGKNSARMMPITSDWSAHPHAHSLKSQINMNSMRVANQVGRDSSDQILHSEQIQRDVKANHVINDAQGRTPFARTRSSPELTDAYADVSSKGRPEKAEAGNSHAGNASLNNSNRRKNHGSESLTSLSSRSSVEDALYMRHAPSQQSVDATADSSSVPSSYHQDLSVDAAGDDFSSFSGSYLMQQEEQDIVNMMASASLQGGNGQVHVPINLATGHLPFPIPSSFLASIGYTQRNLPGFVPSNIPLIDPSFSNMQFPQGLISPQMTHYFQGIGLNSPSEDSVEQRDEISGPSEANSGEVDNDFWQEQEVGSSGGYDPDHGSVDILQPDDKPPAPLSRLKYIPPYRLGASSNITRVQSKHSAKEKRGAMRENTNNFSVQDARGNDIYAEERSVSSRFSSGTHSNSFRSRTSSESSWDGSLVKIPNSTREKRGKKVASTGVATGHGKGKIMSQYVASLAQDEDQEWGSMSNVKTELIERNSEAESGASLQVPRHHLPGFEVAQTSGSDSRIPFAPMLIGPGSRQGMNDNSGLIAFYPTGPPIPFLTMLPLYNMPPDTGTSDVPSGHFGGDETLDSGESGQNLSPEGFDQSEDLNSASSLRDATGIDTSEEPKSDILNSDFVSHWQNLQFGRFCQSPRYHAPLMYPSPVMVPPAYPQGRFPYDNPARPLSTNPNLFSQLMTGYGQRLVPVAPLQSVSSRPPNPYQGYVDDMPRHRSGTGTYLPNLQKVPIRERQPPGTRRRNYNNDRNGNYGDRERNWNAHSKYQAASRSNSRSPNEKSNSKTDWLASNESRTDRSRNSYRHDPNPSYQSQNGPLRSGSNHNVPQNLAYSMYPLAASNLNGVSNGPVPPVVMLYPIDHGATYGSHGEQLEFGSLGPIGFPGITEQSQLNEGARARIFEEHRLHGSSSHRSSPDQPSSPHHQRRVS